MLAAIPLIFDWCLRKESNSHDHKGHSILSSTLRPSIKSAYCKLLRGAGFQFELLFSFVYVSGHLILKVFILVIIGHLAKYLLRNRKPRPVGVVMWTGYAAPEWAWP